MTKESIEAFAAANGISMTAEFVPWSKSRSFDPAIKHTTEKNLNWKVTIFRAEVLGPGKREVLTTDYSAGIGHAPSYKQKFGGGLSLNEAAMLEWEVEYGRPTLPGGVVIMPALADVLHSLRPTATCSTAPASRSGRVSRLRS